MLNPATPLNVLDHVMDRLDLILLMSVNPGFDGQSFIESTLPKIEAVRRLIDAAGRDIWLEVDGGVKADNAARSAAAGADALVTCLAVFGGGNASGTGCHNCACAIADTRANAQQIRASPENS